jgi:hypothetical protein
VCLSSTSLIFSAAAAAHYTLIVVAHRPVIAGQQGTPPAPCHHRRHPPTPKAAPRSLTRPLAVRPPPAPLYAPLPRCATIHPFTYLNLHHRTLCPRRVLRRPWSPPTKTPRPIRPPTPLNHPGHAKPAHTTAAVDRQPRSRSLVLPHLHAHRGACLRVRLQQWRSTSRTRMSNPKPRNLLDRRNYQMPESIWVGRATSSHVTLRGSDVCLRCVARAVSRLHWAPFTDLSFLLVSTGQTSF